jgi:hypothetical protein
MTYIQGHSPRGSPLEKKTILFDQLLSSIEQRFSQSSSDISSSVVEWAESLLLDGQMFSIRGHEYQKDMLEETARAQCFLKGAQVGVTSIVMLKTLHGLISGRYPQGALYLFPSRADVQDFSRGRFSPLINDNEHVRKFVQDTDAQTIKRIGSSMLYLRGARSTARIQGMKRSSSQLKSVPVDRLCLDEVDEMEGGMIDLALERLSHSSVKEEVYLSTPSIPSYGVDALYQKSDQRVWMICCEKCGGETCLELEFPNSVEELPDGRVIRLCQRCRDYEIHPRDGHWVPLYPDRAKEMVGWRISQLNSVFVDPGKILRLFRDPPGGNLTEVYNSKLAQAHIAAENRLTVSEVLCLCGDKPIAEGDIGTCYLGADVGSLIHCVISKKSRNAEAEVVYVGSFPDWAHLDVLMKRFNVGRAVIDALPETRLARQFADTHRGKVYLCFYIETQKGGYAWNDKELMVSANRTEALDASHKELSQGKVRLPKENETLHEFARHCSKLARVLQTDPDTGSSRYLYIRTGDDHYRQAYSYCTMARQYGAGSFFADVL